MAKKRIYAEIKYDVKAHKAFYLYHLTHRSSFIYLMPLLMLIILFIMTTNPKNKDNPFTFIFFICFCILLVPCYLWFAVNTNVRRDSKKRKEAIEFIEINKDKIYREEMRDGVITGKEVLSWYQIYSVYESSKYFFIYTSMEQGFLLPKQAFLEGTTEQFRDYCNKYLKPGNKGKIPFKQARKVKKAIKNGLSK